MKKTLLANHRELTFYIVDGNLCSWPYVKRKNRCNYSILNMIIENIIMMLSNYSRCKICLMTGNRQIFTNFLIIIITEALCLVTQIQLILTNASVN